MEAIRRADAFVDALAGGRPVAPQDAADAELAALLGSWRDETRWPPATGLITEAEAIAALNAGLGEKRGGPGRDRRTAPTAITPRRSHRGLSVVGAAAAAVLSIGGFGAVVAGSGPEDPLYGMRTMLFGAPKQVRDDQVALAARTEMQQVQQLISQGDWQQAQEKLVAVSTQVASIGNEQQKQDLLEQFNDLSAKVVERDPAATAPPGIVYTVPPSATELVPAVAPPTSTPSAPSQSDSATSSSASTSVSASTSPSTSTPAESGTSSSTATSGAATSSAATSAASASSSPASASTSASTSASPQSQQTTTPTSAAPTTTAAPTTSAAPTTTAAPATSTVAATTSAAPRSATSAAPTTTTAPAAAAETTTAAETSAAADTTAADTTAAETTAEVETTAVQATEEPAIESESPAAVTTTAVAPEPVTAGG